MSEFVEVKTSELIGPALDWAVAKAIGYQVVEVPPDFHGNNAGEVLAPAGLIESGYRWPNVGRVHPAAFCKNWSVDWEHGGPLFDLYCSALNKSESGWWALAGKRIGEGETAMVAICRAIVATKFGEVAQVPAELVEEK